MSSSSGSNSKSAPAMATQSQQAASSSSSSASGISASAAPMLRIEVPTGGPVTPVVVPNTRTPVPSGPTPSGRGTPGVHPTVPFNIPQRTRSREQDNTAQQTQAREAPLTEYVCVCSYTKLDNLAHKPRGTPANETMTVFALCNVTGRLTKLTVSQGGSKEFQNAAFVRSHPKKNILYVVTESINENGWLFAFRLCPVTGQLRELGKISTEGRSACYISLSHDLRYILVTNYWDSTLASVPIDEEGLFLTHEAVKSQIPGQNAKKERAAHGDDPHSSHRFKESHAHACVFDPAFGRMAYVPDLGEGCLKQFVFDENDGSSRYAGTISCGERAGPRYLEFHPSLDVCYVVNELASTVQVFRFDEYRVQEALEKSYRKQECPATLERIQEISTLPEAFPKNLNTCGRICVDPTGRWVLVSNRGHDSVAVYSLHPQRGDLTCVGYFHTGGHTPRHFKFSSTGNYLFSANQDSDSVCVFRFDQSTGELAYIRSYEVKSPNFIEVKPPTVGRKLASWVYARM
ncbi:unnamed protein product [Amoebophrya sp. A25]|nr:unnamed protein product [Amoebophrya sp. A25]|eukprot:GSA25T00025072001.1